MKSYDYIYWNDALMILLSDCSNNSDVTYDFGNHDHSDVIDKFYDSSWQSWGYSNRMTI